VLLALVSPGSALLSSDYGLAWVAAFLWVPVEALLLVSLGTTPGKYLLGMRVQRADGRPLSFGNALHRAVSAWGLGCAFLIPLAYLFTFNSQYNRLRKGRESTWDESGGYVVIHSPLSLPRVLLLVVAVGLIIALIALGASRT
jgi:uncharacterized RDD family membrane protein YckC